MTKDELAEAIAADAAITKAAASRAIDALRDHIGAAMIAGETLRIPGFGQFDAIVALPHAGRDPRTGQSITIPAKPRARFRPAAELRRRLAPLAARVALTAPASA